MEIKVKSKKDIMQEKTKTNPNPKVSRTIYTIEADGKEIIVPVPPGLKQSDVKTYVERFLSGKWKDEEAAKYKAAIEAMTKGGDE